MAIYDMNAALRQPNMVSAVQQGILQGQQQRQLKEDRADNAMLRGLAPGIIAGDPAAYDQAAAVDPTRANQYQAAGDGQLRKLKGMVDYVNNARQQAQTSGDMRVVNAALREISPFVARFTGKPGPTEWTPDLEPGWAQLEAKVAGLGAGVQGRVQSTYVDDQGQRVAIMADGTQKVLGGNDAGMSQQTISINGPDGRPAQYTFDKRTGAYVPAEQSGAQRAAPQPPAPTAFTGPDGMPIDVSGVTDPAVRDSILANASGWNAAPDGSSAQLPPIERGAPSVGAQSPFVGRAPEEQAALTTAATEQAKLNALPAELGMRTDAAVDQAVRIDSGKAAAERTAAAPATIATLQNSLDSIDSLLDSPNLGDVVGFGSMNPLNKIPGTEARGLIARADQVAGQAFLAAFNQLKGGGAITEREGAAATAAMARLDRSQNLQDYKQALTDLKAAITPAMQRARQQASGGAGPARVQSAADYDALPSGASFVAPDGTVRRKR